MASNFINQCPSLVPGTSSGAFMVSFSGGSPSSRPSAGHEYTSSLPEFILGDIPTNPASPTQYQWSPPFASPTSDTVAYSHVPQLSGPPHIRLMYSSSMATLEGQTASPAMAIPPMRPPSPPQNDIPLLPKPPGRYRKRVHACSMCEKAFDRPSTLKKHMLVHTGEKSHVCEICSRRFSVASNLNRHVRRCVLRPVNTMHGVPTTSEQPPGADTPSAPSSSHTVRSGSEGCSTGTLSETTLSPRSSAPSPKRISTSDPNGEADAPRPVKKRPRRAPTPTPWIPVSLRGFDLTPTRKSCPVPLAPVRPSTWEGEERDSYSLEELPHNPYHPDGWLGKLPGPACRPIHTGMGMMVQRIELY